MPFDKYRGFAILFAILALVIGLVVGLNTSGGSPPLAVTVPPNQTSSPNASSGTRSGPPVPTGNPTLDFLNMYW